jgi:hypothetical protein
MDQRFDIEITDRNGKLVVPFFKITISREIKEFYKIFNSFKVLDSKSEVLDVGLVVVMLVYDGRNGRGFIGYVMTYGDVLSLKF